MFGLPNGRCLSNINLLPGRVNISTHARWRNGTGLLNKPDDRLAGVLCRLLLLLLDCGTDLGLQCGGRYRRGAACSRGGTTHGVSGGYYMLHGWK